ncbi:glycosyltransferase family 4 protein [Mucilaginibacter sp.]|uniref:glycosyltransferase family 4 protein n=1 Tax=Mucilaginibacter sp. TaxID=1882438 RepID=UPI003D11159C
MRKQIILTKLFEFGGSNSHLKMLIKYFGDQNIILVLEDQNQLQYLKNIGEENTIKIKILSGLHKYAHLAYPSVLSNLKEFLKVCRSVTSIFILCLKNNFAGVTINVVEPEKYLYLLWLPFIRVNYIVHTTPQNRFTFFTTYTCNARLGKKKKLITVSKNNKALLCEKWDIATHKQSFVKVIYNCITETETLTAPADLMDKSNRYIITMGHVIAYKNPVLWFNVAKQVTAIYNDVHFMWLGNGPQLNELKKEAPENERITFKGAVSNPQAYLKNAIIYYQPSLHETHGIAVLEAMYNHLPCVVSDAGGLPESIQDNYNGLLVSPLNEAEHVSAIIKLINNDALRSEYGLNAYKKYQQFFSYEKFSEAMDAAYLN